jgi:hypothetical protein
MGSVEIRCPTCGKVGNVEVAEEFMKSVSRGLLAINVATKIICKHSFIAYVDKNLAVRDYFVADFQIEILEITPFKSYDDKIIPEKDIVDVDLIKLNLNASLLSYILKSIFSKQKIVLIVEQSFLHAHILNFFKYITKNTFEIDLNLISIETYKKNKKEFTDCMVFRENEILVNNKKTINSKKLYIEKEIVYKFLSERELGFSYLKLKNEIQKAYDFSKLIFDFITNSKKDEKPNALKIRSFLEEAYKIKISPLYMNFLIEILKYYFGISIPSLSESLFGIL